MSGFVALAVLLTAATLAGLLPVLVREAGGLASRRTAWCLGLLLPLGAAGLYACLGQPEAIGVPRQGMAAVVSSSDIGASQIEAMVERLAQRLREQPEDVEGWRRLARSYETLQRFDAAVAAHRELRRLRPRDPDVLVDYAVTLGMTQQQRLAGEPEKLLLQALDISPDHVQALALAGAAAQERGDLAQALVHWRRLLTLLPADDDLAGTIRGNIARVEAASTRR
jgi:cytochrome c-type biogenesis protein CcmH